MRKSIKKIAAVLLTAAMTLSTGVMAFASTEVTIHYNNTNGWDPCAAHLYEGTGFTTPAAPLDKYFVVSKNDDGTPKPVWPGAKMDKEFGNWYKITGTFEDVKKNGIAVIFNNGVGDVVANNVGFSEADAAAVIASGIPNTTNAKKEQTGNVTVGPKKLVNIDNLTDVYVEFGADGKAIISLNEEPASYTSAKPADNNGSADNTNNAAGTTDNNGSAAGTANGGSTANNAAKGTGTSSNTNAPKTGDTVAVSVVMFGLLAAVAYVASKKKVNA